MFTRMFWKDTVERVVRSAAGGVLALLAAEQSDVGDIGDLESWLIFVGIPSLTSLALAVVSSSRDNTLSPASAVHVTPPEVPGHDPLEGN